MANINLVDVNVEVNLPGIEKLIYDKLINDDKTMLTCHKALKDFCDKYVPYDTGVMSTDAVTIMPDGVEYKTRYANRQYYLHDMSADLAGETNRTRHPHELATSYWDKAMMMIEGDAFIATLQKIFNERAREISE